MFVNRRMQICSKRGKFMVALLLLAMAEAEALQTSCSEGEKEALLALKLGLSADPKGVFRSWTKATDCCTSWVGVTCGESGGVEAVDLSDLGLKGVLSLTAGLSHLRSFSIAGNDISGTIPTTIAAISSVQSLHLQRNAISGILPPALLHLRSLNDFNVSYNKLVGGILGVAPFNAFPISSYAGNDGLCGAPLAPCVSL